MKKFERFTQHTLCVLALVVIATLVAPFEMAQRPPAASKLQSFEAAINGKEATPCRPKITTIFQKSVPSLRRIDFKDYRYPGSSGCDLDLPTRAFRMRHGQFGDASDGLRFHDVSFGDVSGDRNEAALVTTVVQTDGNAARRAVYIFELEHRRPKVIFVFESGDRAEGGLRKAYAEKGRFILELWGPGNTLADTNNTDGRGLCCPTTYTLSRYRWIGKAFQQDGVYQIRPNPRANTACPACDN